MALLPPLPSFSLIPFPFFTSPSKLYDRQVKTKKILPGIGVATRL